MVLPELVKKYVSPGPVSLAILRTYQAHEDEQQDMWNESQELPF